MVVWSKSCYNSYFFAFYCTKKNNFLLKNSSNLKSGKSHHTLTALNKKQIRNSIKTLNNHYKKLFHFLLDISTRIDPSPHATIFKLIQKFETSSSSSSSLPDESSSPRNTLLGSYSSLSLLSISSMMKSCDSLLILSAPNLSASFLT